MHPQLSAIVGDFESALARLHALRDSLDAASWHRRPARGAVTGWSPAECIAHLNLTSAAFIPLLRDGIEEARRSGLAAPSRYRRDFWGWLVWRMSAEAPRFKVRTTAAFVPDANRPAGEIVREFERLQAEQIALTRAADGLAIHRARIVSPFNARVRYHVYSALTILPRHQHRHLRQAEESGRHGSGG